MSFGFDGYDQLLANEVDVAFGSGSLLVAAAGNDFLEGNAQHSPASLPHVLTIAATDEQNTSSFFSNRSLAVDLSAPGEGIPVAVPTWQSASGYATGDGTEDPEDVYRVWVPARRRVAMHVALSGDADVELWNASTPSVYIGGAARRKHLLDSSGNDGNRAENVAFRNRTRRGAYVFLDVYLPED